MGHSVPPQDIGLPKPGDVLAGIYKVERMIGRGGMGAVFEAIDVNLDRRVAIKLLLGNIAGHPEALQRFEKEGKAAAKIDSEHAARVHSVGKLDSGLPYMVLEYLEGSDLSHVIEQRGPLPVVEVVDYVLQALDAISQAHVMGIVHRDLKPANLFVVRRADGSGHVKVLDFGISKATNSDKQDSGSMTSTKAMLGSPYYMSPEQLRSSKSVDFRTDIWSLGIILYEALTAEVPYKGDNFGELFAAILEQDAPPLRMKRPDVSPDLERVIAQCLQRKVEQRFAHVGQLALALAPHGTPRSTAALERVKALAPRLVRPMPMTSQAASSVYAAPRPNPGVATAPIPQGTTPFPSQQNIAAAAPMGMTPPNGMIDSRPGLPGPGVSTGGAWGGQTTGTGGTVVASKKMPPLILVGMIAVPFLVIGLGIVGIVAIKKTGKPTASGSVSIPITDPLPVPPIATTTASATPIATATAAPLAADVVPDAGVAAPIKVAQTQSRPVSGIKPTAPPTAVPLAPAPSAKGTASAATVKINKLDRNGNPILSP